MSVPKKVSERMTSGLKRLLPAIQQQKTRDVAEADTVTLVKDLLADVFGYDKWSELTGEVAIRGTFCDLAVRIDDKIVELIEVKAIGITLNDRHVKQAVDYAANQGIEWVILTNGAVWRLYHVVFSKPIDKELIAEIDISSCDCRPDGDLDRLFLFSKEGFKRGAPGQLRDRQDATSRFLLAAVILHNDQVITTIRRELRRVVDITVSEEEVRKVLNDEVLKRETVEGQAADDARTRVKKAQTRTLRQEQTRAPQDDRESTVTPAAPAGDSATPRAVNDAPAS